MKPTSSSQHGGLMVKFVDASTRKSNRVTGLFQHVFSIEDPTLAFVGNVKAGLTFHVNQYQLVAIARFLAERSAALPSKEDQRKWEAERLALKGPSSNFHQILPDFEPYFNWLLEFAGEPSRESNGYISLK
ncbi:unnamed protein product [Clonostachys rosea f. rosea IK726]|uniref:Uncharacterized protein n=1 Tax=Clonostachys rosea f. rosea IK726 TaxID=1349383 RepID=A0ACA9UCL1_BIOOC|nr:unnamed protein product [Clonostachys rosea f. rosea IK726]